MQDSKIKIVGKEKRKVRWKVVKITVELLDFLMRQDNVMNETLCKRGIPKDAVLLDVWVEDRHTVNLMYQHKDFAEVQAGDKIPEFQIIYENVKK